MICDEWTQGRAAHAQENGVLYNFEDSIYPLMIQEVLPRDQIQNILHKRL